MKLFDNWADIPKGLCIIKMFHERLGKHCLHLHMKMHDSPWFEQPRVPCYSQSVDGHREFWTWAEENLPVWNYPHVVKANG